MQKKANDGRVTTRRIAELAGVSQATVSRVLSGAAYVSPEARLRVLAAARQCGHSFEEAPNIAVVIPAFPTFHDYLGTLLNYLTHELVHQKFRPMLILEDNIDLIDENAFRGVISVLYNDGVGEHWNLRHRLPLVSINTAPVLRENVYSVYTNEKQGVELGLDYLWNYGHRRVGLITHNFLRGNMLQKARVETFEDYFREREGEGSGLYRNVRELGDTCHAVGELLKAGVSAILAASESLGGITSRVLTDFGRSIPDDVSLVSYEHPMMSPVLSPALTTIEQDFFRIAIEAVDMLRRQFDGQPVRNVGVDCNFIERESVAPPK